LFVFQFSHPFPCLTKWVFSDPVTLVDRLSSKKHPSHSARCNKPIEYNNKVDFWTDEEDGLDGLGIYSKDASFPPCLPSPVEDPLPIALEVARCFGHLPVAQQVNSILQLKCEACHCARHTGWNPSDGTPITHRLPLRPAPLAACPGLPPAPLPSKPPVPLTNQLGPPVDNLTQLQVVRPVGDFKHKSPSNCTSILAVRVHATIRRINMVFEQFEAVKALPADVYCWLHNLGNQLNKVSLHTSKLANGPIALYKSVHRGLSIIGQVSFCKLKQELPSICCSLADISEFGYFDHMLEICLNK
jgi:hypothetical protein